MEDFNSNDFISAEVKWRDLVIFLSDLKFLNTQNLEQWSDFFNKILVMAPAAATRQNIPSDVEWYVYDTAKQKSEIWNEALAKAESDWVLFVEDDEKIIFQDFPEKGDVDEKLWPAVMIKCAPGENDAQNQYYQMRFVNRNAGKVFSGKNVVDCTGAIQKNGISISNQIILLERNTEPFEQINISEEMGIADFSPQVFLLEGRRYFKQRKYIHAAAQYRQILKMKNILPFDKLAAINGLASCATEQFKWEKALSFTGSSVSHEPLQNLPYLIEFRIYQLQRKWKYAYKALNRYYESSQLHSRAGFDVIINEEEVLLNLADLSFKMGERNNASEHLDALFYIKNGNVQPEFLKKLLLLSLELKDERKATYYFNRIFDSIPDISNIDLEDLNEFMALFIKNEWYEFVYEVYNELYMAHPKMDEFRRRLIVASIKTKRVKQARELAVRVA